MEAFGERLTAAFGTSKVAEIARKLDVSYQAAKNYLDGRVPDADKLTRISELTGFSIHWLLTGKGQQRVEGNSQVVEDPANLKLEDVRMLFHNFRPPESEDELEQFRLEMEILVLEAQSQIKQAELLKKKYESDSLSREKRD